jgi:hypothetical protein
MGAWEWYDCQVKLAEGVVHTRRNKPVDRRGAAIHVRPEHDIPSESTAEQGRIAQKKHVHMQLARGHKLKEKLVKGLGLSMLLSPEIW